MNTTLEVNQRMICACCGDLNRFRCGCDHLAGVARGCSCGSKHCRKHCRCKAARRRRFGEKLERSAFFVFATIGCTVAAAAWGGLTFSLWSEGQHAAAIGIQVFPVLLGAGLMGTWMQR